MKSTKFKLIASGLLLAGMTLGTSYAWWNASQTVHQDISMGELAIEAAVSTVEDPVGYEPGLTVEQTGTITNSGSIETLVKIENDSKVTLKGQETPQAIDGETIQMTIKPAAGDDGDGYWYQDSQGNNYVLLAPEETAKIDVITGFNGDKMGADYMGAAIDVAGNFKATQAMDGATAAEFGITLEDLTDYPDTSGLRSGSQSEAMRVLTELMTRGKKG